MSIYRMYEDLCGTLTPWVAAELEEAEAAYPLEWLEAAFKEAALQNVRRWRYVARILECWRLEGMMSTSSIQADAAWFEERYRKAKGATG